MTRTVLAIATALLAATTLAPAAEACVSCDYVPPVVNSGTSKSSEGKSYATKPYQKSRSYTAAEERRARVAKKRVVKSEPVAKDIDTAAGVPSQTSAENENSTISAAVSSEPASKKVETATTTPVKTGTENENSTISTAAVDLSDAKQTPVEEAKVDRNVGCKKFFPTVGMTLSVPCE